MTVTLFAKSIVDNQSIYVNGHLLQANVARANQLDAIAIPLEYLHAGKNEYAVSGQKFRKRYMYDEPNQEPGSVQILYKEEQSKRDLFNGYAQVLVKIKGEGCVTIKAETENLPVAKLEINKE